MGTFYQGRMLTDDLTLSTAGLENNSVVHLVERAPPTQPETSQNDSESANNESSENENSRRNSRNRIRSQLERHTSQFMTSVSQVVNQDVILEDGQADTDMQSFARQLSNIGTDLINIYGVCLTQFCMYVFYPKKANGLELLPDYLRILADQIRNDPTNPTQQLQDNLHHLTTITQRLGALSNTLSNIQVPIRSPPPRRLELNRRLPQSLRDFGQGQTASGGIVIPVVHGSNGSIETGPITSLGGNLGNIPNLQNLIGTAVGNAIGGIQNNLNGLFDGGLGQENEQTPPSGAPGSAPNEGGTSGAETGGQNQNTREPSLTARVMTMISRPSDIDGNPIDRKSRFQHKKVTISRVFSWNRPGRRNQCQYHYKCKCFTECNN